MINTDEWRASAGSVGKAALGVVHICDDDGNELPTGEPGIIYFERDAPAFDYHNDPEKTEESRHPDHDNWSTVGDIGYLDEDGYLFLTDRKAFMIISGGVNIYPQEVENVLALHPEIYDVAVIGVPDPEMGQQVKAVVQIRDGVAPSEDLATEIIGYVRERLAHFKAPRSVDFIDELPRSATGKLVKRKLQQRLCGGSPMSVELGNPTRTYDPVSISPLSFWADTAADREKSFKILRDERPISWHRPIDGALMAPEIDGVWAVTRHEDISYVSKNPELFCSGQGVMIEAVPEDILDAAQSFLAMDGTKHSTLRRLVSSVFTPRQVAKIQDQIEAQAIQIVDELLLTKEGDFVEQVSKRLPMWTIYEMMGLPSESREEAAHNADGMVSWADEDVAAGRERGKFSTTRSSDCSPPVWNSPRATFAPHVGPDVSTGAGRDRRAQAHRRRTRRLLRAALGGRQRHHAQHHHAGDHGAAGVPRAAGTTGPGLRRAHQAGDGGVRALGESGDELPPDRHA